MNKVTLKDLVESQNEVLKRIGEEIETGDQTPSKNMAGHSSTTQGHRSGGIHTSHSSGVVSAQVPKK